MATKPTTSELSWQVEAASTTQEVIDLLSGHLTERGFTALLLGHMSNPMSHPRSIRFIISVCPPEMMKRLQDSMAFLYDTVLMRMLRATAPFSWTSVHTDNPPPHSMLFIVRQFGFEDGYAFPIRGRNGTPGGMSLCGPSGLLDNASAAGLHDLLRTAFHRLEELSGPFSYEQDYGLTALERATLLCAAGGKGTAETGLILGVPQDSVREAIRRARRKLQARTTAQAVATAMYAGIIV